MKPVTERLPKALIPVAGVPFAHHQLQWLARQGATRVIYAVGHLGGMIRDFVGDGRRWGLEVASLDEGETPRGTAGAIRLAVDRGLMDDGFFVLYGDSYLPIALAPVWEASARGETPLMTVFRNDERWDRSNAIFEKGRVTRYEKGRADASALGMRHIDYGLSVLTREVILELVPAGERADLAAVFHRLSREGRLLGHEVFERFYEIGSPQGLKDLEAYLSRKADGAKGGT